MNAVSLLLAKEQAKKFLIRVELVEKAFEKNIYLFYGSKETAACKRASMDLTRALARLRSGHD